MVILCYTEGDLKQPRKLCSCKTLPSLVLCRPLFSKHVHQVIQLLAGVNKKAVLSQGNRAMPQLFLFVLKFADDIHYKFNSSQASKARLQSSKRA